MRGRRVIDPDALEVPWAVADVERQSFVCQRCGVAEPFVMDIVLVQFADLCTGFARRHAECRQMTARLT